MAGTGSCTCLFSGKENKVPLDSEVGGVLIVTLQTICPHFLILASLYNPHINQHVSSHSRKRLNFSFPLKRMKSNHVGFFIFLVGCLLFPHIKVPFPLDSSIFFSAHFLFLQRSRFGGD